MRKSELLKSELQNYLNALDLPNWLQMLRLLRTRKKLRVLKLATMINYV